MNYIRCVIFNLQELFSPLRSYYKSRTFYARLLACYILIIEKIIKHSTFVCKRDEEIWILTIFVVKTNSSEFLPWQSGRLIINHKSLLHFIQNIWPRMRRNNITDYDLLSAFTTNKILNSLKTFVLMPCDCLLILNSGRLWREKGKGKMLKNTDVTSEPVEVNIFWRS